MARAQHAAPQRRADPIPEASAHRPRLWWANADFDLTLAHGGGKMPAKILEAARAMAWHLWPALAPDDALIVPEPPPDEFLEYLSGLGLTPPRFLPVRDSRAVVPLPDFPCFTPFGWNDEAMRINARGPRPSAHPGAAVIRRVNSRAFGLELERALFGAEACPAAFCASPDAVNAWLAGAAAGRYVAKGNHGHAGIGQLRFALPAAPGENAALLLARLRRLAARHGGVVFEEEQLIEREWGLLFRLGRGGGLSSFRVHRLLSGPGGGYAGALVLPGADPAWASHAGLAEDAARRVAAALRQEGYFGPVGMDVYAHRNRGALRLRPLVDLNARLSMALPAHGLAARFPDRAVLLRQVPTSMFHISRDYKTLQPGRDKLSFDSATRRGAVWLTPLLPLARHSVAFFGDDETGARRLQHEVLGKIAA